MHILISRLMTAFGGSAVIILAVCCGSAHADIAATVNVDAANVRSVMSPMGIGLHTSPYYNAMTHSLMDDRLEEAGVTTLRYGGGGYADVLHWSVARPQWESGITGGGLSPWWGEPTNFGYVGPGSDYGSFIKLVDQIEGGQAVATVNYGSAMKLEDYVDTEGLLRKRLGVPDFGGQPKEAAAMVAYANADASIYGTPNDVVIGVDQQGNDWKTAGYWAKLRASTSAEYQSWAQTDGVFNSYNSFLAINRDAPAGIQYWEIGNETFGTGYYGGGNGYSVDYDVPYNGTNRDDHVDLSPAQYGQEVVQYSQLMKSIDPSIKIGAVLATPPDDYNWSYADLNDSGNKQSNEPYWNDEVLSQAGIASSVDFVMVHWYPYAGENANGSSLLTEVRTKIPHMINGTTSGLDSGTNRGIRDSLSAHGLPNAEIMITEFNYFGSLQVGLENAAESIFVADAYASWLDLGVTSVQYLEMMSKDFVDDSMNRRSAFYGISMVDKLVEPGESLVNATTSNNSVRTHAALQDDGSIAVMLLNLHQTETANVAVNISNIDLDVNGTRYLLTGGTSLTSSALATLGNAFNVSLAPRSISTFVIAAAPPGLAGDFDEDGDVDGRDFLLWQQDSNVGNLSDWQENYGTVPELTGNLSIPEPASGVIAVLVLGMVLNCRLPGQFVRGVGKS
jgi:alpha-L-arabinofuranosidase